MLDRLNDLTPAFVIGGLLFFMTSETWFPYFKHGLGRKRQRLRNLGMVGVALLMATPDWHRVHHSVYQPETDSHYGCVFSVWDRLFGTTRKTQIASITFGLERYREPNDQTVWKLLKMPFGKL